MITLITGEPGSGKTAYVVNMLASCDSNTVIYSMGIPELHVPHLPVPPLSEWVQSVTSPEDNSVTSDVFTFFEGSLIVIDEAQKVYRLRPPASRVPPIVSAFETHRHQGLNFILVSQFPTLIDTHVRRLVGRHVHLTQSWSGRKLYEWSHVGDPSDRSSLAEAVVRPYRLPKQVFGLYKSASLHQKSAKRRIPISALVVLILAIVFPFLVWSSYRSIKQHVKPESEPVRNEVLPPSNNAQPVQVKHEQDLALSFVPRINTRPETAPLYDPIRKPSSLPVVMGCIKSKDSCKCYTDQATDAMLTFDQCTEWLKVRPYNPWRVVNQRANEVEQSQDQPGRAPRGPVDHPPTAS